MAALPLASVTHSSADYDLDPEVLVALWAMEDRHFWTAARNLWIAEAVRRRGVVPPARVLDVGCGAGSVARHLQGLGFRVTGVDTAAVQVSKAAQRCPDATFVTGRVEDLPAEARGFDLVALCDVLEHVEDSASLLAASVSRARRGAVVVVTVPALMSLYSVVDEIAGHKRRYEMGELAALLRGAGLVDVEERGIFRSLLPVIRLSRARRPAGDASRGADVDYRRSVMVADLRVPPAPVNAVLAALCALERRLGFARSRGARGTSLLATGRVA